MRCIVAWKSNPAREPFVSMNPHLTGQERYIYEDRESEELEDEKPPKNRRVKKQPTKTNQPYGTGQDKMHYGSHGMLSQHERR